MFKQVNHYHLGINSSVVSFYAIAGQYFVVQFVISLFLIWLPTYLTEQYHVEFKDMTISSLPWFIMFILILSAGAISDKILRSGQSRSVSRGLIAIVGFIVFAVSIFFAVHTENLYVTIFWLSLGLGGMGVSMGMSWARRMTLVETCRYSIWLDELMG